MSYRYVGETGCITHEDLSNLEGQAEDLNSIRDQLCVPFKVFALRSPKIAWLNHRWLKDRGLDPSNPELIERIRNWITSEFGYVVASENEVAEGVDLSDSRIFFADRYGSNNGLVAHGGSGRASVVGKFHIKGIGATPLVGRGVNREHSHGAASLNVAIREAIYSEICNAEFPHGAVPVLAIIDTGLTYESSGSPARNLRRAIIIRPGILRPAHMQRAAGFIDPVDGHANSQIDDCRRVEQIIHHVLHGGTRGDNGLERIYKHFERVAEQIAFGRVHRLYNGGYFSSNLTIDGELLDFGNMHALPNWINLKVLDNDLGFGREMLTLEATIRSLDFYIRKFSDTGSDFEPDVALSRARAKHDQKFREELQRSLGLTCLRDIEGVDVACGILNDIFIKQQKIQRNYTSTGHSTDGWIIDDRSNKLGKSPLGPTDALDRLVSLCRRIAEASNQSGAEESMSLARTRYLGTRRALLRDAIQEDVDNLLADASQATELCISSYIDLTVSRGRRHWKNLEAKFAVKKHYYLNGDSVLWGRILGSDADLIWLEGSVIGDIATLFENRLKISDLISQGALLAGGKWQLITTQNPGTDEVRIGDTSILLPEATIQYDT